MPGSAGGTVRDFRGLELFAREAGLSEERAGCCCCGATSIADEARTLMLRAYRVPDGVEVLLVESSSAWPLGGFDCDCEMSLRDPAESR